MGAVVTWLVGSRLTAPVLRGIGPPPADLRAESVEFGSASGARLRGWYARGEPRAGVIVLMHGVRASRLAMIDRARFLHRAGHAVLLFDFQAHGESVGRRITFGYLESRDAQAAIAFARARATGENVGIIGVSQGGAAALIASPPLEIDAAVIEQVYSEIDEAIGNRLALHLGGWARVLSPLLS
jgi:alpha-beta hydrolase superfamily lysophospholipase